MKGLVVLSVVLVLVLVAECADKKNNHNPNNQPNNHKPNNNKPNNNHPNNNKPNNNHPNNNKPNNNHPNNNHPAKKAPAAAKPAAAHAQPAKNKPATHQPAKNGRLNTSRKLQLHDVGGGGGRSVTISNNCPNPIWVRTVNNNGRGALPTPVLVQLARGANQVYTIPDGGWAGQFRPKTGCDAGGNNCDSGDSLPPCPANGCAPPAETKIEFNFEAVGSGKDSFYDVSLVDGYNLPAKITPLVPSEFGTCTTTVCHLNLNACPADDSGLGSLLVQKNGRPAMCLSPCKRWNSPAPYGLGRNEQQGDGAAFCCPTPPVSVQQCRAGKIKDTRYVQLVRQSCPSAYSYAYDDVQGLHNCPTSTSYNVVFCG